MLLKTENDAQKEAVEQKSIDFKKKIQKK